MGIIELSVVVAGFWAIVVFACVNAATHDLKQALEISLYAFAIVGAVVTGILGLLAVAEGN